MTAFEARATRGARKLRLSLVGPSGSGKTKTALLMAEGLLAPGQKIGLLDTEQRSSSLYADAHEFYPFYMAPPYEPQRYVKAMYAAAEAGNIGVLIIDSLSHAWIGSGGVLEQVDQLAGNSNDNRNAWKKMTPIQQQLIETIIACPYHVIATLRTKDAYGLNERNQRVKIGLAPVQRDGVDYEFDVALYLDQTHTALVDKSRIGEIMPVGSTFPMPGAAEAKALGDWLASGVPVPAQPPAPAPAADAGTPAPAAAPAAEQPAQPADPFAAKPDPTPAPSQGSEDQPAPAAASAPAATPDAAPASAGTSAPPDPFGATNGDAPEDPVMKMARDLIDQKRRQLVSITAQDTPPRGDDYWVAKIEERCAEWYGGKPYADLDANQIADLGTKLEQTRLALIAQRQPAGAA